MRNNFVATSFKAEYQKRGFKLQPTVIHQNFPLPL